MTESSQNDQSQYPESDNPIYPSQEIFNQGIELNWDETLSRTSSDNLVGRIGEYVVKRSKEVFATREEAESNREYLSRQIALYQKFLPDHTVHTAAYTVPDTNGFRIFQFQPLIDGVTTKQLSEEKSRSDELINAYSAVYRRLFTLYRAEHDANRYIPEDERFQLTRVQPIGIHAYENRFFASRILASDNLMVNPKTGKFFVFDFGQYQTWVPKMERSHDRILELGRKKFDKYTGK